MIVITVEAVDSPQRLEFGVVDREDPPFGHGIYGTIVFEEPGPY